MTKFLRRAWNKYSKLGKGRKKKQKWRSPKGRDNKMREKRRGYAPVVSIGYKRKKNLRGKIDGKQPVLIYNPKEIESITKNQIIILGKIGKKKKLEIAKKANEKKIKIYNLNINRILKKEQKAKRAKEIKNELK